MVRSVFLLGSWAFTRVSCSEILANATTNGAVWLEDDNASAIIITQPNNGTTWPANDNESAFIMTQPNNGTKWPEHDSGSAFITTQPNNGTKWLADDNAAAFITTQPNTGTRLPGDDNASASTMTQPNTGTKWPADVNASTLVVTLPNNGTKWPPDDNASSFVVTQPTNGTEFPEDDNASAFVTTQPDTGTKWPGDDNASDFITSQPNNGTKWPEDDSAAALITPQPNTGTRLPRDDNGSVFNIQPDNGTKWLADNNDSAFIMTQPNNGTKWLADDNGSAFIMTQPNNGTKWLAADNGSAFITSQLNNGTKWPEDDNASAFIMTQPNNGTKWLADDNASAFTTTQLNGTRWPEDDNASAFTMIQPNIGTKRPEDDSASAFTMTQPNTGTKWPEDDNASSFILTPPDNGTKWPEDDNVSDLINTQPNNATELPEDDNASGLITLPSASVVTTNVPPDASSSKSTGQVVLKTRSGIDSGEENATNVTDASTWNGFGIDLFWIPFAVHNRTKAPELNETTTEENDSMDEMPLDSNRTLAETYFAENTSLGVSTDSVDELNSTSVIEEDDGEENGTNVTDEITFNGSGAKLFWISLAVRNRTQASELNETATEGNDSLDETPSDSNLSSTEAYFIENTSLGVANDTVDKLNATLVSEVDNASAEMSQPTNASQTPTPSWPFPAFPSPPPGDPFPPRVVLGFTIENVDFDDLNANPEVLSSFTDALRWSIASEAGSDVEAEHVEIELSQGSVKVVAIITPPGNSSASEVASALSASTSFAATVVSRISMVNGIGSVATGPILVTSMTPAMVMTAAPTSPPTPFPETTAAPSSPTPSLATPTPATPSPPTALGVSTRGATEDGSDPEGEDNSFSETFGFYVAAIGLGVCILGCLVAPASQCCRNCFRSCSSCCSRKVDVHKPQQQKQKHNGDVAVTANGGTSTGPYVGKREELAAAADVAKAETAAAPSINGKASKHSNTYQVQAASSSDANPTRRNSAALDRGKAAKVREQSGQRVGHDGRSDAGRTRSGDQATEPESRDFIISITSPPDFPSLEDNPIIVPPADDPIPPFVFPASVANAMHEAGHELDLNGPYRLQSDSLGVAFEINSVLVRAKPKGLPMVKL